MRHLVLVLIALVAASCARDEPIAADATHRAASDASGHAMITPEQVKWQAGPPSLPPGAQFAVLEGDPAKSGFFAMRVKFPSGYTIPPHTHPVTERVTIMSGTLHLGMGGTFDKSAAHKMPAGTYAYMQPGVKHFAWAEGDCVVQLIAIGPWGITYVNPADDPRKK